MGSGLTGRMVVASGLLALVVGGAFAVLLTSVADLRADDRRALRSQQVLVTAHHLERLIVDLETGQRASNASTPCGPSSTASSPASRISP